MCYTEAPFLEPVKLKRLQLFSKHNFKICQNTFVAWWFVIKNKSSSRLVDFFYELLKYQKNIKVLIRERLPYLLFVCNVIPM